MDLSLLKAYNDERGIKMKEMNDVETPVAEETKSEGNRNVSFNRVRNFVRKLFDFGEVRVAVVIDGPNLLRRVNGKHISLEDLREKIEEIGHIVYGKAIVSKETPSPLLQALTNSGFEPIVSSGKVHVRMAVEVVKMLQENELDILIIASRDAECVPLIQRAKERGTTTIALGFNPGFSSALKNSADKEITLELQAI